MKPWNHPSWKRCAVSLAVLAGFIALVWCGASWGLDHPVVVEAEKDGIDLLYMAIASAITLVAGTFVKRPQDFFRERRNGGGKESVDAALKAHEDLCAERSKGVDHRLDAVDQRLTTIESDLKTILFHITPHKQGA